MNRRQFISLLPAGLVAARAATASDASITVLLNEPNGTISPLLHGHFTEHIGGVIYNGVWVGENSPVPNVKGIRRRSSTPCAR